MRTRIAGGFQPLALRASGGLTSPESEGEPTWLPFAMVP
jgi:hypothetical protein